VPHFHAPGPAAVQAIARRTAGRGGSSIEYREQAKPAGIAQAFLIAESFIGDDNVTLILGDNVFYGGDSPFIARSASSKPARPFSVIMSTTRNVTAWWNSTRRATAISIEEKPKSFPKSNYAVPGLYIYDNGGRGHHLGAQAVGARRTGNHGRERGLSAARAVAGAAVEPRLRMAGRRHEQQPARGLSAYVQTIEKRAGVKIGCPEEAAFRAGFLSLTQLEELTRKMPKCEYRDYLDNEVIAEARRLAASRP
jgi:glucose-1-phosphate thymidylyltransferase